MQKQQTLKAATTNSSHSYIYSDISRAVYREESLLRKLKHIQEENNGLQQEIKEKEEQIKDQRTIIIYQMGELVKVISTKLNVFEDYDITKKMMIPDSEGSYQGLKQLMEKFETIQVEQRMIDKARVNLEKMYDAYSTHKQSIQTIMRQSAQSHHQAQEKIRNQINQKKAQVTKCEQSNNLKQEQINKMKQDMVGFVEEQGELNKRQSQLKEMISLKEKQIEQIGDKYRQICKWHEIIIDKKGRIDLYNGIKEKSSQLLLQKSRRNKIEIQIKEGAAQEKKIVKF